MEGNFKFVDPGMSNASFVDLEKIAELPNLPPSDIVNKFTGIVAPQVQRVYHKPAESALENYCDLRVFAAPHRIRKTGIICTIGPACRNIETLKKMIQSGMNIARMNFSHGTHEYHEETIKMVREASKQVSVDFQIPVEVAIALDTKGPEIRTGLLAGDINKDITIETGAKINVTTNEQYKEACSKDNIYVDYINIVKVVKPGSRIFIDDGLISLIVEKIEKDHLKCKVENGGELGSKKGVNLPNTNVDLPAVSEKDKEDLLFGVENRVDMVFASFIRNGQAIEDIRQVMGGFANYCRIIAKIENHQGVENIDEILAACDGIMVARGDLGIEILPEKVFLAQKMLIAKSNRANKPVIVATQMLDSMIKKPRPTRAEVSDVGNAVLDGADCVMLSGETAKGDFPVRSVQMQHEISLEAEEATYHTQYLKEIRATMTVPMDHCLTVCCATVDAVTNMNARAIIAITTTGRTAQMLSQLRPKCGILAVTRDARVARQLHLFRGVLPIHYPLPRASNWVDDVDLRVKLALKLGQRRGFILNGDPVIVLTGWMKGSGLTNTMRIIWAPDGTPPAELTSKV